MEYVLELINWLGYSALALSPLAFLITVFWSWKLFTLGDFIISFVMFIIYTAIVLSVLFSEVIDIISVIIGVALIIAGIVEMINQIKLKK